MKRKPVLLLLIIFAPLVSSASESFSFRADSMKTILAQGREQTVLKGNARVVSGDTEITADEIELFGKDFQFVRCSKNVLVVEKEKGITLSGESIFHDRKKKITRADSWSVLEDTKNEIIVKGGFLEYFSDEEITIIQIGVRILKENMASRAEYARYNRKTDVLELSGLPLVHWKGDEYKASRIVINLEKDEITLEGDVEGRLTSSDKDEKENADEQ